MELFNTKLIKRIGMWKMIGLIAWLIGYFTIPYIFSDVDQILKIALLLWYITLWAIVWVFWVWDSVPLFNIKMPFWLRWMWIWAWMNFVLALFIYNKLDVMMIWSIVESRSPFWIVAEWAIFWLIVDFITTKCTWEGKMLLKKIKE